MSLLQSIQSEITQLQQEHDINFDIYEESKRDMKKAWHNREHREIIQRRLNRIIERQQKREERISNLLTYSNLHGENVGVAVKEVKQPLHPVKEICILHKVELRKGECPMCVSENKHRSYLKHREVILKKAKKEYAVKHGRHSNKKRIDYEIGNTNVGSYKWEKRNELNWKVNK